MKVSINIPTSLNDITLNQYQQWLKIADKKEMDNFLQQKLIEIFCNIPLKTVTAIKATDADAIVNDILKLFKEESPFKDRFILSGVEYGFIPDLNNMTLGEYVDLDNLLTEWEQMHIAMNVLFRPITYKKKNKYLIEEYEAKENANMKLMPLDIVFGAMTFFLTLNKELQKNILNYLATQTEVEISPQLRVSLLNGAGINLSIPYAMET
tara:strand:- start:1815 stop:2441 length:627 start_codon:yes stop_codon:yes gene_type:complete